MHPSPMAQTPFGDLLDLFVARKYDTSRSYDRSHGGAGSGAGSGGTIPGGGVSGYTDGYAAALSGRALSAALDTRVRAAYVRMCGYLHEPATRAILYGPVKGAVLDACGQLQTLLHATGQAEEYEPRLRALAAKLEAIEAAPSQPAAEAPPPPQAAPIPEEAGE